MKRLSIRLDDVPYIRSTLQDDRFDPVQMAVLAEIAGANGIVGTFTGNKNSLTERDVRLLKNVRKTFFNLRIPLDEEAIRVALDTVPDMVTFVQVPPNNPLRAEPLDISLVLEDIDQFLPDLQANGISIAVLVAPEISSLRSLTKIAVDYVEFNITAYTGAQDVNEELVALDKIKSATIAAVKLGLGVNCSGGIRLEHLPPLARIPSLEDIVVGTSFLQSAMLRGVEKTVQEFLQHIRAAEVE